MNVITKRLLTAAVAGGLLFGAAGAVQASSGESDIALNPRCANGDLGTTVFVLGYGTSVCTDLVDVEPCPAGYSGTVVRALSHRTPAGCISSPIE